MCRAHATHSHTITHLVTAPRERTAAVIHEPRDPPRHQCKQFQQQESTPHVRRSVCHSTLCVSLSALCALSCARALWGCGLARLSRVATWHIVSLVSHHSLHSGLWTLLSTLVEYCIRYKHLYKSYMYHRDAPGSEARCLSRTVGTFLFEFMSRCALMIPCVATMMLIQ